MPRLMRALLTAVVAAALLAPAATAQGTTGATGPTGPAGVTLPPSVVSTPSSTGGTRWT